MFRSWPLSKLINDKIILIKIVHSPIYVFFSSLTDNPTTNPTQSNIEQRTEYIGNTRSKHEQEKKIIIWVKLQIYVAHRLRRIKILL